MEPDHIRRFREEANRLRLRSLLLGHKEDVSEFDAMARELDAAADRIERGMLAGMSITASPERSGGAQNLISIKF